MRNKSNYFPILFSIIVICITFLACEHKPFPDNVVLVNSVNYCSTDTVYFQNQVLPLLVSNCAKSGCHDVKSHKKGQVLTSYDSVIITGKIIPFDSLSGNMYDRLTTTDINKQMPQDPDTALTRQQISLITRWIMQGALNNSCAGPTTCDTSNVSFSVNIKPILDNKCVGCHNSNFAYIDSTNQIELSTFEQIDSIALTGKLFTAVNHTGTKPMPKYIAKMSDCEINMIKAWIDQGALNN